MSILKLKLIGAASLLLGAVSCKPSPVYPITDGSSRPYPERPYNPGDQRPPYNGEQEMIPPNLDPSNGIQPPPVVPPPSPPVTPRDQYPLAERTDNPNRVLSPFAPYNVIDVEGFRSGQLAKDPSNGKIFRVP